MAFVPLNDNEPIDQYTATAGQTTFAYTWLAFAESDIKVYVNGSLKTLTTDYTISAVNQANGANVVFNSGLTLNDAVTISRDIPIARTTGYTTSGSFRAETLNIEQNKELAIMQQLERDIGRAVTLSASSTLTASQIIFPDGPTDAQVLGWDGTNSKLAWLTPNSSTYINTSLFAQLANANTFTALQTFNAGMVAEATAPTGYAGIFKADGDASTDYTALYLQNNSGTGRGSLWTAADAGNLKVSGDVSVALRVGNSGVTGGTDILTAISTGVTVNGTLNADNVVTDVREQEFLTSGTYTPDANLIYAVIHCWGGGGAGGGAQAGFSGSTGGGGGAGGYSVSVVTAATIGVSQVATVGAGGTGVTGGNGNAGGDTSIGSLCIGKGGSGGATSGGAANPSQAGAGGVVGTGDIAQAGDAGHNGIGTTGTSNIPQGGKGGSTLLGGATRPTIIDGDTAGAAAHANSGCGGGGASAKTNAQGGGAGGSGYIFIVEYCSD